LATPVTTALSERTVFTEPQAACYLGISLSTLRRQRHARRGPDYVRIDRSVRYRKTALDQFIEQNTVRCNGR
jgi:predicted DNA-binding transcriptional regulator AlpA